MQLGTDLEAAKRGVAIVAARAAANPVAEVINRIEHPARTVDAHCAWFAAHVLAEKRTKRGDALSAKTLYERRRQLDAVARHWRARSLTAVTRRQVAEFLESFPPRASNQYRSLLRELYDSAMTAGLRDDNPADGTRKRVEVVARKRLSADDLARIREIAEPWMQRAMDLALYSLQRREDLVLLRADEHWRDGKLYVRQAKTAPSGHGLLRIAPGPMLRAAIIACLQSDERGDCPFLIHRIPTKTRHAAGRIHDRQVSPEMLSREFARLRDLAGVAAGDDARERPTWHEIRSTGADEYRQAGWTEQRVQALLGHASIEMTREYLGRREERWVDVRA
ncbi:MAG TPA: tyrosine-type recombinase/integrase [Nevskiaceae bacterium]|nr:tyrosine-type recombinase/integrase [Nevskiaceae bacterium]